MVLLFILFFGLLFTFLYDIIPDFNGKGILVGILFVLIGGFFLAYFLTGGSSEEGSGVMYRGVEI